MAITSRNVPYLRKPLQLSALNETEVEQKIDAIAESFLKRAPSMVASVAKSLSDKPKDRHPFIFFHLRKSGGSTIRNQLVSAAHHKRLRSFVPCFNGVTCGTYSPPESHAGVDSWAIYGGHLDYPSMMKSLYASMLDSAEINPPKLPFDCFVIVRETTSRVQSCWNYRLLEESFSNSLPFEELSLDEVKKKLPYSMSRYGEGCNNEAVRMFSSSGRSEEVVNTLTPESLVAPALLTETLQGMQQCVVGVLERCEDTMKVVRGFFPWFSSYNCSDPSRAKVGRITRKEPLSTAVRKEIIRQNTLDDRVYKVANALLDAQLSYLGQSKSGAAIETARVLPSLAPRIHAALASMICVGTSLLAFSA